jgi:hypothetical protein
MKRIKVTATLFILLSASLMNYHDQSSSSVNYLKDAEMISCTGKSQSKEITSCSQWDSDYTETNQQVTTGKNYEASMIIM